jgi:hypothetical protein
MDVSRRKTAVILKMVDMAQFCCNIAKEKRPKALFRKVMIFEILRAF